MRCRNRPERSLGSNQVDLGGMTSPASATAISSSSEVGNREKATAAAQQYRDKLLNAPGRTRRRRH